jgi:hypothetical protein
VRLRISIKDISSMNGQQNIYHTMGLLKIPPVNGRVEQANVIGIPGLWMDFDVKGGNHKNQKLPDSIDECLEFLKTLNHPPSVIVASGGGLHAYWLFDKILYFKNDEERDKIRNLSKNFQQSIILKAAANGWGFDDTSDLARLLRIPGTFNYKNIKNPKNVEIIKINDQKYSIDQFEDLNKGKCPNSNKFDKSLILQGVPKGKRNEFIFRYILYPDIFIHACIFLIGSGANGKSVLVNTLSKLVGIENVALLELNQLSNRFMLSTLKDKLLNTSTLYKQFGN